MTTNARLLATDVSHAPNQTRQPKPGSTARQSVYLIGTTDEAKVDVTSYQPVSYNWAGAHVTCFVDGQETPLLAVRVRVEPDESTALITPLGAVTGPFYGAFVPTPGGREVPLAEVMALLDATYPKEGTPRPPVAVAQLTRFHALTDKRFFVGLTPDESAELRTLAAALEPRP